jgi:hypothetical protein
VGRGRGGQGTARPGRKKSHGAGVGPRVGEKEWEGGGAAADGPVIRPVDRRLGLGFPKFLFFFSFLFKNINKYILKYF